MASWAWALIVAMVIFFIVVVVVAFIHLKDESDPRPGVASHRGKEARMTQPHQETMYDRVNGEVGIRTLVERFYYLVLSDPSIAHRFPITEEGMSTLRRHFALAVGQVLGGPKFVEDAAAALQSAHSGMGISGQEYWRTVSYLFQTMSALGIPADIADHVFHTVWALEDVIVEEEAPTYVGQ
jgi:hemoglobin